MTTTDELRADAIAAHATFEAVRLEKNFWQLVVIIALILGVVLGAVAVRCGQHYHPHATIAVGGTVRVVQLELLAFDLNARLAGCNQTLFGAINATLPGDCGPDPLGGPCAISWSRIWPDEHGQVFVGCGPKNWWIVTWRGFNPREKP